MSKQKWIPVAEKLPKPGTQCVVWIRYKDNMSDFSYADIDKWDLQFEDPTGMGGQTIPTGLGWNDNHREEVTHWMPLPEPPK